jgi:hypothetical protein
VVQRGANAGYLVTQIAFTSSRLSPIDCWHRAPDMSADCWGDCAG